MQKMQKNAKNAEKCKKVEKLFGKSIMFNVYLQSISAGSTKCGTKYCRYQKFAVILQSISRNRITGGVKN